MENQIKPVTENNPKNKVYASADENHSVLKEPSEVYYTPTSAHTFFTEKSLDEYTFRVSSFEKKKTVFCLDEKF